MIVLHVVAGPRSRGLPPLLTRLVLADRGSHAARHIVVSLIEGCTYGHALQDAGVEVHCLGLAKPSRMPGTLIRLIVLMRRIRPDVVMTWLYHGGPIAHA